MLIDLFFSQFGGSSGQVNVSDFFLLFPCHFSCIIFMVSTTLYSNAFLFIIYIEPTIKHFYIQLIGYIERKQKPTETRNNYLIKIIVYIYSSSLPPSNTSLWQGPSLILSGRQGVHFGVFSALALFLRIGPSINPDEELLAETGPQSLSVTPWLASSSGLYLHFEYYFIFISTKISISQSGFRIHFNLPQLTVQLTDFSPHKAWFSSHILTNQEPWFRLPPAKIASIKFHTSKNATSFTIKGGPLSPPTSINPTDKSLTISSSKRTKLTLSKCPTSYQYLFPLKLCIKTKPLKNKSLLCFTFTYHHPSQLKCLYWNNIKFISRTIHPSIRRSFCVQGGYWVPSAGCRVLFTGRRHRLLWVDTSS
ncbi:hypothetical protein VP01_2953g2 [Puccinia sorghi]|uniref:Uncharacterized protein n=1 Tax=Puccinia sorghi TaxID=27349 RepID=A0A0L6V2Q0_9BASI|nr:hypothetical protein VP01_2953g2 [Puccinia sorghi]